MAETLGTIRGQIILDVKQALNAYTATRLAHLNTVTALHTGAGALTMSSAIIAGTGVAMAAGIMTAVDAAAKFEKQLDFFGAVSDATVKDMEAIREKALQLGADTIFSASDIADSFVELGKAGVPAKDIINGIGEAVANLAAAADIPLDTAAIIVMSAVQTFGMAAEEAIMVTDKLAGAANASIVEVEDLGTSLKYAGGVAASLGVPFEDLNTAIALLGTFGIRGSTAGTSLRKILLSLSGATPKATNALKELGIITEEGTNKFFDATGSVKPLAEVFQILKDATAGLNDEQKVNVLNSIFQNRALASIIGLTGEGADGFNEMAAAIDKTTAAEVAGKRLNNLAGDIEILTGNIDTLLISGGSGVQEFARGFIQGITGIIQAFIDLPKGVQTGIVVFLGVVAVLLILIGTLGLFAGAVLNMIALGIQLKDAFLLLKGMMTAWRSALVATTAVQWALNAAMAANPIGLIILAIAAVVAALVWFFTQTEVGRKAWSEFMNFLGEAWTNIVNVATSIWTELSSFFTDFWNGLVSFFTDVINGILDIFYTWHPLGIIISNWEGIVAFFETLWNNIVTGVTNFITGIITYFQELPGRVVEFFSTLPERIGFIIGFVLGTIVRGFLEIGQWLFTNVPLIIGNIITWFQELPGKVYTFFSELYTNVQTWMMQLAVDIIIWAIGVYQGIVTWFQELPGRVASFFTDLYEGAKAWMIQLMVNVIVWAIGIYNGIVNWIKGIPAAVTKFFQDMVNGAKKKFAEFLSAAIKIGVDIFNNIRNGIAGIPGLVTGIFNNVVNAIKGVIGKAVKAVTDFASGLWNGFKKGLGIASPSYIEHAMWAITGVIDEETQHMKKQVRTLQALGNGISEMGENVGFNTSQLDRDLITLQDQLAAAKAIQSQFASGNRGAMPSMDSTQVLAIAGLKDTLENLKTGDIIYDIDIENPEPETASESIPKAIRKSAYVSS